MSKNWTQHDQYSWSLYEWSIDKCVVKGIAKFALWRISKSYGVYDSLLEAKKKYEEYQ